MKRYWSVSLVLIVIVQSSFSETVYVKHISHGVKTYIDENEPVSVSAETKCKFCGKKITYYKTKYWNNSLQKWGEPKDPKDVPSVCKRCKSKEKEIEKLEKEEANLRYKREVKERKERIKHLKEK